MIVYNTSDVPNKFTILKENANYKSIGVKPYKHCVFKCNNISANKNEKEEYISCDRNHFAIYAHGKNDPLRRLKVTNNDVDIIQFGNALCESLMNRNGMCFLQLTL